MAASPQATRKANATAVFDLKSATLTVLALLLKTSDLDELAAALQGRYGDTPGLFENEPLCIDLAAVRAADQPIDFKRLLGLLRGVGFNPVAVRAGSAMQMAAALAVGLAEAPEQSSPPPSLQALAPAPDAAAVPTPPPALAAAPGVETVVKDVPPGGTLIIDRPVRSGQRIYARGGDLIVLAVVNSGAEVVADGHVHVYAPLRGRALAGLRGDLTARVFSTCMEAQLVSIAGLWRTSESGLPPGVWGKMAQVRLEGEKLVFEPIKG